MVIFIKLDRIFLTGFQGLRAAAEGPRHPGDGQIESYSLIH